MPRNNAIVMCWFFSAGENTVTYTSIKYETHQLVNLALPGVSAGFLTTSWRRHGDVILQKQIDAILKINNQHQFD